MSTTTEASTARVYAVRATQPTVPIVQRTTDLLKLAQSITDITSPTERLLLSAFDVFDAHELLPHLHDAGARLLSIIAELHEAEQLEKSDDPNADAAQAEKHRASAHGLAEGAVRADLKAAGR